MQNLVQLQQKALFISILIIVKIAMVFLTYFYMDGTLDLIRITNSSDHFKVCPVHHLSES